MCKKIKICYRSNSDLASLQVILKGILKLESLELYLDFELNDKVVVVHGTAPHVEKGEVLCGAFDFDDFVELLKERSILHQVRPSNKQLSGRHVKLGFEGQKIQIIECFCPPKILYHYTTAEVAIKILALRSLRLSPSSCFNDDFDTKFQDSYILEFSQADLIKEIRKITSPEFLRTFPPVLFAESHVKQHIQKFYTKLNEQLLKAKIFCLAENFGISSMWAHYANRHKGVVLGISVMSEFNSENSILKSAEYRHVRYVPKEKRHPVIFDNKKLAEFLVKLCEMEKEKKEGRQSKKYEELEDWIKFNCVVPLIYTKSEDWSYEREWRCSKFQEGEGDSVYYHENLPKNQFSEIILGHEINPDDKKAILQLIRDNGFDTEVYRIGKCLPDFGYEKISVQVN